MAVGLLAVGLLCLGGRRAIGAAAPPAAAAATPGAAGAAADAPGADLLPADLGAAAYGYVVPHQPNFVTALGWADVRWLHVEGRYNYEALRTGSVFLGVRAAWSSLVRLKITPMLGGTFGDLIGLVPALRFSLAWWKLDLSSESEFVVDLHDAGRSFFYDWTELGFSPLAWLRVGAAMERDQIIQNSLLVQRGLFAGVTLRFVSLTFYEFNVGWTSPTFVFALSATF